MSVAELAETALERGHITPNMCQIIVEHLMGDSAPASLQGDTVESILERVADVPYKPISVPRIGCRACKPVRRPRPSSSPRRP